MSKTSENSWQTIALKDVAKFHRGRALSKSDLDPDGSLPAIHYGELFTTYNEVIGEVFSRTNKTENPFLSTSQDVLMPTSDVTPRGLAKACAVNYNGAVVGGDVMVIRFNKNHSPIFFSYLLNQSKKQILRVATGTTVFHIYASDICKLKFNVPEIEEQLIISRILSTWDDAIAANEELLANSRRRKKALMQQLLTGKTRLPGFGGEWRKRKLGDTCQVDPDSLPQNTSPDYTFLYVSLSEVSPGRIEIPTQEISFSEAPSRARRKVVSGDILMSTVRPNLLGFAQYKGNLPIIASTGFAILRAKDGYSADFIYQLIFSHGITKQIQDLVSGSNYPAISSADVKSLKVSLPAHDEQVAISDVLSTADREIEALEHRINNLKTQKKALMQQLLTGKKRVKVDPIAA